MAANNDRSDSFRWSDIHATDNAWQHNGHSYNNTTHNYAGPTPHINVPVKPLEDRVHRDLILACQRGQDSPKLNLLLGRGADIDYRDEGQLTPLHYAALSGSLRTVRFLVDNGADIHAFAYGAGTPLHAAASRGRQEITSHLIDVGADVNAADPWIGLPLHSASFCGSTRTVSCLLKAGADKDALNQVVGTPLSISAARGHQGVVDVLLEHKADVDLACGYFGSAAHMACAVGNVDILQRLQEEGAHFDLIAPTCYAFYRGILESVDLTLPIWPDTRDLDGKPVIIGTPVILSIEHGRLEAATFCIDSKLDQSSHDSYEQSWYNDSRGRLLSAKYKSTRLAIEALDPDMLQLLLDRGVPPQSRGEATGPMYNLGRIPRMLTANRRDASACISILIRHGVRNDCAESGGYALLMEIMGRDEAEANYETAEAVLQHGAQVNAVDDSGRTALMIATKTTTNSRLRFVRLLCENGAAVDLKDNYGHTALDYARAVDWIEGLEEIKQILQSYSQKGSKTPSISST